MHQTNSGRGRALNHQYLLLHGPSSALGQFAVVVHGGCPAPRRLSIFAALWVQHPPGALSCSLVLDADKAAVKRQIVSYRVLREGEKSTNMLPLAKESEETLGPFLMIPSCCRSPSTNGLQIFLGLSAGVVVNVLKVMFCSQPLCLWRKNKKL